MSHSTNRAIKNQPDLLASTSEFFHEGIVDALNYCAIITSEPVKAYLVALLEHYLVSDNLYIQDDKGKKTQETLAEMYLRAQTTELAHQRNDLLRRTGETSLYIGGFFGDSLQRKLVDLDYYVGMGEVAYRSLANVIRHDDLAEVYGELSGRFGKYVDVLTYVSQKSLIQSDQNLLRLYERYIRTGSDMARAQLIEQGILMPEPLHSDKKQ
jgi:hypothetical protein